MAKRAVKKKPAMRLTRKKPVKTGRASGRVSFPGPNLQQLKKSTKVEIAALELAHMQDRMQNLENKLRVVTDEVVKLTTPPPEEYWITRQGEYIAVGEMEENHVRNALRMILRRRRERAARVKAQHGMSTHRERFEFMDWDDNRHGDHGDQ